MLYHMIQYIWLKTGSGGQARAGNCVSRYVRLCLGPRAAPFQTKTTGREIFSAKYNESRLEQAQVISFPVVIVPFPFLTEHSIL